MNNNNSILITKLKWIKGITTRESKPSIDTSV